MLLRLRGLWGVLWAKWRALIHEVFQIEARTSPAGGGGGLLVDSNRYCRHLPTGSMKQALTWYGRDGTSEMNRRVVCRVSDVSKEPGFRVPPQVRNTAIPRSKRYPASKMAQRVMCQIHAPFAPPPALVPHFPPPKLHRNRRLVPGSKAPGTSPSPCWRPPAAPRQPGIQGKN